MPAIPALSLAFLLLLTQLLLTEGDAKTAVVRLSADSIEQKVLGRDATTTEASENAEDDGQLIQDLQQWVVDNGGIISDSIVLRRIDPNDPQSTRGMFATADIQKGETILAIPVDLIIRPNDDNMAAIYSAMAKHEEEEDESENENEESADDKKDGETKDSSGSGTDDDDDDNDACDSYWLLYNEFRQHQIDPMSVSPYVRYLHQQARFYLPTVWSPAGKDFLIDIIGKNLPPTEDLKIRAFYDTVEVCDVTQLEKSKERALEEDGFDQDLFLHAYMIVSARADDDTLVPIYDMMNHRNGKRHYNTNVHPAEDEAVYRITANQDIMAGQQIYNSYNQCNQCGSRQESFGTPEMFESYGFVEPYPQRFIIEDVEYQYEDDGNDGDGDDTNENEDDDDEDDTPLFFFEDEFSGDDDEMPTIHFRIKFDVDQNPVTNRTEVNFLAPLHEGAIGFMEAELERLNGLASRRTAEEREQKGIPQLEWDNTWALHGAYVSAFTAALEQAKQEEYSDIVLYLDDDWFLVNWDSEGDDYFRRYEEYMRRQNQSSASAENGLFDADSILHRGMEEDNQQVVVEEECSSSII
mmetsp:Transcript_5713/g.16923  ORF Transcript_5713/g.16923 Transcript_5713/m.16923 type:complete len:581 (-) Transcript_5713:69-1811(-)